MVSSPSNPFAIDDLDLMLGIYVNRLNMGLCSEYVGCAASHDDTSTLGNFFLSLLAPANPAGSAGL